MPNDVNEAPPATVTVPLISGRVKGPLGVTHLPRLWWKLRLNAAGRLPSGYRYGEGGSDGAVCERFGIDRDALLAFVASDRPDYLAFETWIRANARTLTPATIDAHNVEITTFAMADPRRSEWTARFALPSYTVAARLNELDDWDLVHAQITASDAPSSLLVPAISSSIDGPLGAIHLPRLWLKFLVHLAGRLPDGYHYAGGMFDGIVFDTLGIDREAFVAFMTAERPGYLATERWVRDHATTLTPEAIAASNERLRSSLMPEHIAVPRRERYGIDPSIVHGIALNDLDDWGGLHESLRPLD